MNIGELETTVVVIRQKKGPDIVGIVVGGTTRKEGVSSAISSYMIEHPFVPVFDYSAESFALMPYCPLTDQTIFEFRAKDMVFMVPAKDDLAKNYLTGLSVRSIVSVTDTDEVKSQKLAFHRAVETLTLSPGTETLQ